MRNLIKNLQVIQSKSVEPQDLDALQGGTENTYKLVTVIGQRANQINSALQSELKQRFREFESYLDGHDDYKDNKEQAEVSRLYEVLPHPTLLSLKEMKEGSIEYRRRDEITNAPTDYDQEPKSRRK